MDSPPSYNEAVFGDMSTYSMDGRSTRPTDHTSGAQNSREPFVWYTPGNTGNSQANGAGSQPAATNQTFTVMNNYRPEPQNKATCRYVARALGVVIGLAVGYGIYYLIRAYF